MGYIIFAEVLSAWDISHMSPDDPGPLAREVERRMLALEMNPKHLSRAAGLGETYVRDIITGRSKNPRTEHLEKLADALGCTVEDLRPKRRKMTSVQIEKVVVEGHGGDLWTTAILEMDPFAGMGGGGLMDQEKALGQWQIPTNWLRQEIRGDLRNLVILTVEGDSMGATLVPGDKVVVDMNRKTPSPPGIFLLFDGMGLVAKRIEFIEGSNPPTVRIMSDNPRYPDYTRTTDEINIVGRIMARWERLS